MPRGKQKSEQSNGESVGGYFRRVFAERPELLGERSNDELLARWLKDHPQHKQVPVNVKNNLANVKSVLRKKGRKRRGRKARSGGTEVQTAVATLSARTQSTRLERLEEHIDEALTEARILDRAGLERVIQLLRRARNEVVWMIGQ
jgi:hypothetical protein